MADVRTPEEVQQAVESARSQHIPFFVLGGGSNIIVRDAGFNGLVLRMRIPGFEILEDTLNDTTVKIGAGENWDETVKKLVDMGLSGVEAMSGIPGTSGAAPVQNVGAYGQEIADTLVELSAFDTEAMQHVVLQNDDCEFSYRHSIFRGSAVGRYIITSITLKLSKNSPQPPFYEALQRYLDEHEITIVTHQAVRDAVLAIRANKLPDPANKPNTGSFFKNAIIDEWRLHELRQTYPDMPSYDMGGKKHKVPTGWLIEQTGLRNTLHHGMRVHDGNALVLVNESASSYQDLADAREEIIDTVRDKFQIIIQQEPLEL